MKNFWADLHIHSALSPCASDEMTPSAIVRKALDEGLSMIAICDHNSALNVSAFQSASEDRLSIIAGMEITTTEEVHVVGLFPDEPTASAVSKEIRHNLPDRNQGSGLADTQKRFDLHGNPQGEETKNLSASSGLDLASVIQLIKRYQGLAMAAHVDRSSFGVLGQLGFFPSDLEFDALEVTAYFGRSPFAEQISKLAFPIYCSSDSHFLGDIGTGKTMFSIEAPTFEELSLAIFGVRGRGVFHA